jgi:hypothetical protein
MLFKKWIGAVEIVKVSHHHILPGRIAYGKKQASHGQFLGKDGG